MCDLVGDEDDGDAPLARLNHDAQYVGSLLNPERGGWLVEDQHSGAKVDGATDREGLALTAGQAADEPVAIGDLGDAEFAHLPDGVSFASFRSKRLEMVPAFVGSAPTKNERPIS